MFRKQLFYLTSEQLCAYQWHQGKLGPGHVFANDAAGLEAFAAYLESRDNTPAYLLTDLIEEDFQRQSLPHVGGKTGRALLLRRLTQLYRDTPFRMASVQGRDEDGRRDDQVLFSALTNPALPQPWLAALELARTPLAGMYSASFLGAQLVQGLRIFNQHLLMVTRQSGGVRQSYFQDGQLRFSRLTPAIDRDGVVVNLAGETAKTHQFLTSTRALERGDVLHAVILAPLGQMAALAPHCHDGQELTYRFIAMEKAAGRLGLDAAPALSDQLLLNLLARHPPASHYALGARARFYQLWRARIALFGASAALAAATVLTVGANLWGIVDASVADARLRAEARAFDVRYHGIMSSLPPQVDKTRNMKAAVTIDHLVTTQAPTPLALTGILSEALDRVPQINLLQLDWKVDLPAGRPRAENSPAAPISSLLIGFPVQPRQTLRVEAEVKLSQNDYRSALGSMQQLIRELARHPHLSVEIEQTPLDVRPNVKLAGKAATETLDGKAKFILNLAWNP
ncbi:MAG TPA: hypothetical protein DCW29_11380 [Janthinobacterium sp.]|nr:hypothetical protein [Janthinobacterium sp.]